MKEIKIDAHCECGNEIMGIEYWEDEKEFCFVQYRYMPLRHSFLRRIKFLFTGMISYNEIMLSVDKANKIADFIKSVK